MTIVDYDIDKALENIQYYQFDGVESFFDWMDSFDTYKDIKVLIRAKSLLTWTLFEETVRVEKVSSILNAWIDFLLEADWRKEDLRYTYG